MATAWELDRRTRRRACLAAAASALALTASTSTAQAPAPTLSAAIRTEVVDTIAAQVGRLYVDADTGAMIAAR